MTKNFDRIRWVCFAGAVLLSLYIFKPAVDFSMSMFRDSKEDLGHGWVIPLVSAYAIWKNRASLKKAAGNPCLLGWLATVGCLILFWLGSRGEQARLMQLGMIGLVMALPCAFWGLGLARKLIFPTAYLLFILPTSFMDFITFRLRLLAAWLATAILNGVGMQVRQIGTALISTAGEKFNLDVADPCSGMRSIFALAALTAAYAFFAHKRTWQRLLLFASAVPLAIAGNIARIISIACVAYWMGQEKAVGFYHDYSGYVVFVVAVLLMLQVDVWVSRLGRRFDTGKAAEEENETEETTSGMCAAKQPCLWRVIVVAAVPVTLMAALLIFKQMPAPQIESGEFIAKSVPESVAGFIGFKPLFCQNEQCMRVTEIAPGSTNVPTVCEYCESELREVSLGEKKWLPGDTRILKRNYRKGSDMLAISVVVSGVSRQSIHRPEMCLPGQGFHITSSKVEPLELGNGRRLQVKSVRAARTGEPSVGFIYWFVNPRQETTSHWVRIFTDVWSRSVYGRVNRWCMITVFGSTSIDDPYTKDLVEEFLSEWYPQILLQ